MIEIQKGSNQWALCVGFYSCSQAFSSYTAATKRAPERQGTLASTIDCSGGGGLPRGEE